MDTEINGVVKTSVQKELSVLGDMFGIDWSTVPTEELQQLENTLRSLSDRCSSILRVRLYPKQGHYV